MDTADVVMRYYELANSGDWDAWCDLFAEDQKMDEQLAGHVEGRETLRGMMKSFPARYAEFANRPVHVVVQDGQAAVVSHISARTVSGEPVEADVCNYFRVEDGLITYMTNVHDTVPFTSLVGPRQKSMSTATRVRWSHVGLNCRDQAATEEFYTRWFGFRRARVVAADDVRVIFLRCGDVYLEMFASDAAPLVEPKEDGPTNPGTARHLAFQVDDVDAFLAEADGSLPIMLGPLEFGDFVSGWKTVWVTDPDGVIVEVSQGYVDQSEQELAQYA